MNITPIEQESIKAAFKESMSLYPEAYPLSCGGPSEDAVAAIVEWVKSSRDVETDPQGSIEDWTRICVKCYCEILEDEEEFVGENYQWCMQQAS